MTRPDTYEQLHDLLVATHAKRLASTNKYASIETHVQYSRQGYHGEFDVLAKRKDNNILEYHEIKSTNNHQTYRRALRQFSRARRAYPQDLRCYYVTPGCIVSVNMK